MSRVNIVEENSEEVKNGKITETHGKKKYIATYKKGVLVRRELKAKKTK